MQNEFKIMRTYNTNTITVVNATTIKTINPIKSIVVKKPLSHGGH